MQARAVNTIEDAIALVEARGLTHVKIGVSDIDGILRGKYLSTEKFISTLKSGLSFCNVVLGWDSQDQLYDNVQYTGWHTAYPDAQVRLLPQTCRDLPCEPNEGGDMLFFLGEFVGDAEAVCPRALFRRMLDKASAMGFDAYAALEYEFFFRQVFAAQDPIDVGHADLDVGQTSGFDKRNRVFYGFDFSGLHAGFSNQINADVWQRNAVSQCSY